MTFTSKKEADAYDKMLDIADNLQPFIQQAGLELEDTIAEQLAFYFATNKDEVIALLKGSVAAPKQSKKSSQESINE